ncbi:uncharacterized protein EI90DRAFT_3071886 [Cantharellus anzutake]|uniref:uncharacterized protein n=1 Tax=Cantharellus anzutake TaxID=1750568 RepID=UPI001902E39C|nr:uncharacterized protein EI90DRAFT_3071886 [Cantharellus anzutake]KAF8325844.1 hypothetical protein EI90DRAFT_3071886 [Cantharellus anzutake]
MDQLRACFPCFHGAAHESDNEEDQRAPELDGLLFNSENEQTGAEADAMSLHSNVGRHGQSNRRRVRQKGSSKPKTIRLFGYNLFGRRSTNPPSPSQSEDEAPAFEGHQRIRTISGASLDPDATPLPDSAIDSISRGVNVWTSSLTDEQIAQEEEEQREREERRARRAARRLRKQQLAESADVQNEGAVFEGFPGGDGTLARDSFRPSLQELEFDTHEFGPYVEAHGTNALPEQEEPDEEVDVGGEYNRRSRSSTKYGSGDGSSSWSRSHASSALTDGSLFVPLASSSRRPANLNLIQQRQAPHNVPLPPSSVGSSDGRRTRKSKSANHARSPSSASTSQPSSIPSPIEPYPYNPQIRGDDYGEGVTVSTQDHSFPSAGFTIPKTGRQGLQASQGVALAWNGDL